MRLQLDGDFNKNRLENWLNCKMQIFNSNFVLDALEEFMSPAMKIDRSLGWI